MTAPSSRIRTKQTQPIACSPLTLSPLTLSGISHVPYEICDNIVAHLQDDRLALTRLSLVSKAWLRLSRWYLFEVIKVNEANTSRLEELLASPYSTIPSYIASLDLSSPPFDPRSPGTVLERDFHQQSLPKLAAVLASGQIRNVCLEGRSSLWIMSNSPIEASFDNPPILLNVSSVTSLTLRSMQFSCISEATIILQGLPGLRSLTLDNTYWCGPGPFEVLPPPSLTLVDKLRVLRVRSMSVENLVEWLLLAGRSLALVEMDIGLVEAATCGKLCRTIDPEMLRTLSVHNSADAYAVEKFRNLRTIYISIHAADDCKPAIFLLKRLGSFHMRTVKFAAHTRFFSSPQDFFQCFDWKELIAVLGAEKFRWLDSIEFAFDIEHSQAETRLAEKLSELHEQGKLANSVVVPTCRKVSDGVLDGELQGTEVVDRAVEFLTARKVANLRFAGLSLD
ncbi:hypothetical protein BDN71DRAFT_1496662 [Pleurotus eryngii]|uniref:F-box domain-containing protein n=1 Tax=Pleurotus eryngii TaxID=5323 RepID=A0A9P5ZT72_PLEER|nr:hypothetical protein BDN71DRAFT_1496662 [Pleurotus eryngii]